MVYEFQPQKPIKMPDKSRVIPLGSSTVFRSYQPEISCSSKGPTPSRCSQLSFLPGEEKKGKEIFKSYQLPPKRLSLTTSTIKMEIEQILSTFSFFPSATFSSNHPGY